MTTQLACDQCRDNLIEFAAGSLSQPMSAAVAGHLETCSTCSQELAEWVALDDAMRIREQQVPPDRQASPGWTRLEAELPVIGLEPSHTTRRHSLSARYRLIPAIAALLLIALGSAVFGVIIQGRIPHSPAAKEPPVCQPNQISAHQLKGIDLQDLSMASPDAGWATGINVADGSWVILHYHHCQWTTDPVRLPNNIRSLNDISARLLNYISVSAVSATDAWALAQQHVPSTTSFTMKYIFLHYTGGQWQQTAPPMDLNSARTFISFTMVSASEGWLTDVPPCGQCGQIADGSTPTQLYHGVNGVWSPVDAPAGYRNLWLIRAYATGVAWITAESDKSKGEMLMLYHNGVLSPRYWLPAKAGLYETVQVQMDTPEDTWITMGDEVGLLVLHCSLSSCKLTPLPGDPVMLAHGGFVDAGGTSATVAVYSASAGWAFLAKWGPSQVQPTPGVVDTPVQVASVYQLRNGRWQPFHWPFHVGMVADIVQVAPNEYWAFTPTSLLHYVNGSWSVFS